jgi:hypothetical protein
VPVHAADSSLVRDGQDILHPSASSEKNYDVHIGSQDSEGVSPSGYAITTHSNIQQPASGLFPRGVRNTPTESAPDTEIRYRRSFVTEESVSSASLGTMTALEVGMAARLASLFRFRFLYGVIPAFQAQEGLVTTLLGAMRPGSVSLAWLLPPFPLLRRRRRRQITSKVYAVSA